MSPSLSRTMCVLCLLGSLHAQKGLAPAEIDPEAGFGVRAELWPAEAAPGEEVRLRLVVTPAEGRYVYSMTQPKGMDMVTPLSLRVEPNGLAAVGDWEEEKPKIKNDEVLEITFGIHDHTAELSRRMKIPDDAGAKTLTITGRVEGMSCSESSCNPAKELEFKATLKIDPRLKGPQMKVEQDHSWALAARIHEEPIRQGASSFVSVWIQPAEGRYIYAMNAGNEDLVPTEIRVKLPGGFSIGQGFSEPEPHRKLDEFLGQYFVHEGRTRFFALLTVGESVKPGLYEIPVTAIAMACDAESCLPAEERSLTLKVRVSSND